MARQPGSTTLEKFIVNDSSYKKNNYHDINQTTTSERTKKSLHKIKSSDNIVLENISENFKRLDNYEGFFSTQQIEEVDYEKFENHVFFDSAVAKVQYAFAKVLNEFPYDKSEYDVNQYLREIDGFTRYVLDKKIPKSLGYLNFDGTSEVFVKDCNGNILNDFKGERKFGLIDLNKKKFSFEFWIYVKNENIDNDVQIVFQKKHENNGITIYLDSFTTTKCNINVLMVNGDSYHKCTATIDLQKFQHVNFSFITLKGKKNVNFYLNGIREKSVNLGSMPSNKKFDENFVKSSFFIGNGLSHTFTRDDNLNVIKSSGLKGIIDDFRFFAGNRKSGDIKAESKRQIFARSSLNIYFRFNEPSSEYVNNNIVLDYSGNKVHGLIRNSNFPNTPYTQNQISVLRQKDPNIDIPLIYEIENISPVLFPNFGSIISDQELLLNSAEKYDKVNPNTFYKLFPKYIFVEGSDFDGLETIFASKESIQVNQNDVELLGVTKPTNSALFNILVIWSRFFDQLKTYVDHVTKILDLNYDSLDKNNSSVVLPLALAQIGIDFKEIFPSTLIEKLNNKNLTRDEVFSEASIRQIQNNLWKRFLINSQDFVRSKGTISSLKSVFNSFGLEADNFIRFREFNSQNKLNIHESFTRKIENIKSIDFLEGKIGGSTVSFDDNGKPTNRTLLECDLTGKINFNTSNWCLEQYVKFNIENIEDFALKQNLLRLDNFTDSNDVKPYISVVFERTSINNTVGNIKLYVNETNQNSDIKVAELSDVNLLSGKIFYIQINKFFKTATYSDYSINIIESDLGSKNKAIKKSNVIVNISNKNTALNSIMLRCGNANLYQQNTINSLSSLDFYKNFEGRVCNIRFWNKTLKDKETLIHKTDIFNVGTIENSVTDSQNNLLINLDLKEKFTSNISNKITNNYYTFYNNVNNTDNVSIVKLYVPNSMLNSKHIKSFDYIVLLQNSRIDYPENYSRVNISSFNDQNLKNDFENYNFNPSYSSFEEYPDNEDIRFTIDFSVTNFIDKEMSKMILVNDFFSKTLSNASSLYEEKYQSLYELENIFYKKLESQVSVKQLYQIYKYFDNILEDILHKAIPTKVHYHGFNFVYESHIAERPKYVYKMSNSRLPIINNKNDFSSYDDRYYGSAYWKNSSIREDLQITSDRRNDVVIRQRNNI